MICTRLLSRSHRLNLLNTALKRQGLGNASLRDLATKAGSRQAPRPDLKGTVLMYKLKSDRPWVFGMVGTLGTALGVSGAVIVQQMIKGELI